MQARPSRDDDIAREWQTLARKLSHARGFCFIVYFVHDQRIAIELKRRLDGQLRAQGKALRVIAVDAPQALVASSMAMLFDRLDADADAAADRAGDQPLHPLCWLEAFRGAGRPEWDTARGQLLMRLNERRSRLEAELRAPLVLLLPAGAQRSAATLAPDLWHVRVHSAPLVSAAADVTPASRADERNDGRSAAGQGHPGTAPLQAASSAALNDSEPRAVTYWREQQRAAALQTAGDPSAPALQRVDLWDGFNAIIESLGRGRFTEAQGLIDDVLPLALAQWHASSDDQRARAQHDLAAAYGLVGQLAHRHGRLDAAATALEQALQHMRAVVATQDSSPSNLYALSALLNQHAHVLKSLERLDAAGQSYAEALRYLRLLAQQSAADAEVLDGLAATLSNIGDLHRRRGGWDDAAAALAESLALSRDALRNGGSPSRRRQLGVVLVRIGRVAEQQGRLDEAADVFGEALDIDRALLADLGETPQALDDIATDLQALAELDGLAPERRLAAAAEAVQWRQRQVDLYPDVESFRLDLEQARQTLDNLQRSAS